MIRFPNRGRGSPVAPSEIPSWVASVSSRTFTSLASSGAATWNTGAGAVIPSRAYRGTNPIGSIMDAYADPAYDPITKKLYFFGGGHGDGSCNALVCFDLATLTYSLECDASPTSEYPPNYLAGANNYTLPSGLFLGNYFRPLSQLPNPIDQPYAAAISKPVADHRYGSQAVRAKVGVPREIHYFYAVPKVYNLDTHAWDFDPSWTEDRLWTVREVGARANIQSAGLGNNIGFTDQANHQLGQGTMCVYDDVTDQFLVTLVGGGYRYGFFLWDAATRTCPRVVSNTGSGFQIVESTPMVKVGRWVYIFTSDISLPYYQRVIDRGIRFNFDSGVIEYFNITGQSISHGVDSNQECAPCWYSAVTNRIAFWSHNPTDKQNIYELDVGALTAGGGTGAINSAYSWTMTKSALSGTAPSVISYKYNGVVQIPEYGLAVVLPHSTLAPIAIEI